MVGHECHPPDGAKGKQLRLGRSLVFDIDVSLGSKDVQIRKAEGVTAGGRSQSIVFRVDIDPVGNKDPRFAGAENPCDELVEACKQDVRDVRR